jgi:hypothetical protein
VNLWRNSTREQLFKAYRDVEFECSVTESQKQSLERKRERECVCEREREGRVWSRKFKLLFQPKLPCSRCQMVGLHARARARSNLKWNVEPTQPKMETLHARTCVGYCLMTIM